MMNKPQATSHKPQATSHKPQATSHKPQNSNLHKARTGKNDEFYTQRSDIEQELKHYKEQFRGKVVYCNCDDPRSSQFFHYFSYNFEFLGLKKLIATCYKNQSMDLFSKNDSETAVYLEYTGDKNGNRVPDTEEIEVKQLKGDGDFRNQECIELLKEADIVVTNPPFSLFREYIDQLMEYDKEFLIVGSLNAIAYKKIFSFIKGNKIWQGYNGGGKWFKVPEDYEIKNESAQKIIDGDKYFKMGNVIWFTNLETPKRKEDLILHEKYTPEKYPKYDNFDAINVDKVKDIPCDYTGVMGVPISFLEKHNPAQFEIIGTTNRNYFPELITRKYTVEDSPKWANLNGTSVIKTGDEYKGTYTRILIKRKEPKLTIDPNKESPNLRSELTDKRKEEITSHNKEESQNIRFK